jgi:FkbM family methyltransferase
MVSISCGKFDLEVLSIEDPYAQHLMSSFKQDSTRLRNFIYSTYSQSDSYIVADVGANIGLTSLLMADILPNAIIHAFEPAPDVYQILRRNILSETPSIIPVNMAIADKEDDVSFISNSAYGHITKGGAEGEKIQCKSLYDYAKSNKIAKFDMVKVDVEGYELDVFRGLKDITDVVFFEFNPWCICSHYRGNPLEVLEEIMNDWTVYRFTTDLLLEREDCPNILTHDTIVYKSLDDFLAVRKSVSEKWGTKIKLNEHLLEDKLSVERQSSTLKEKNTNNMPVKNSTNTVGRGNFKSTLKSSFDFIKKVKNRVYRLIN